MKPDLKGLTKLAEYMRIVPREKFDMWNWWVQTSCGTAGCILGHASVLFPRRFERVNKDKSGNEYESYRIVHKGTGETGEDAFARAFRISHEDAADITMADPEVIKTPKLAAKSIMQLVKRLTKE